MADGSRKWVPPGTIEELQRASAASHFSSINKPTAGPRSEAALEAGSEALQLYSLATPNGWKAGILLEELGVPYDAHIITIMKGDQFTSGFVGASPNSKIPALVDRDGPGGEPIAIMESCAMMLYLCEKFPSKGFLPSEPRLRAECMQWLFWQAAGQGPMTGNYGHFMVYAPADQVEARNYGVARYGMEVQRLCDVLERHLAGCGDFRGSAGLRAEGPREFLVGDRYTVADMACWPWFQMLRGKGYDRDGQPRASDFLGLSRYPRLHAWADRIGARIQVKRGMRVCSGSPKPWLDPKHPLHAEGSPASKL